MGAGKKWLFFERILLASRGFDSDYSKGHSCNDSNASLLFAVSEGRGSSSTINYNIIPTAAVL